MFGKDRKRSGNGQFASSGGHRFVANTNAVKVQPLAKLSRAVSEDSRVRAARSVGDAYSLAIGALAHETPVPRTAL
jgi:hypothetical protein